MISYLICFVFFLKLADNAKQKNKSQDNKHMSDPGNAAVPLVCFSLCPVNNETVTIIILLTHLEPVPAPGVDVPESQQYHPEELSKKALAIIERVRQKLTGSTNRSHVTDTYYMYMYM